MYRVREQGVDPYVSPMPVTTKCLRLDERLNDGRYSLFEISHEFSQRPMLAPGV